MNNLDKLIEVLNTLTLEERQKVNECIKYDNNVSELILSLKIELALAAMEGKENE